MHLPCLYSTYDTVHIIRVKPAIKDMIIMFGVEGGNGNSNKGSTMSKMNRLAKTCRINIFFMVSLGKLAPKSFLFSARKLFIIVININELIPSRKFILNRNKAIMLTVLRTIVRL